MEIQHDPCLNTEEVAQELGLLKAQVRVLIRAKILDGEKQKDGRWCIRLSKLTAFRAKKKLRWIRLFRVEKGLV